MQSVYIYLSIIVITGSPKRYILDKTDKGFTNVLEKTWLDR